MPVEIKRSEIQEIKLTCNTFVDDHRTPDFILVDKEGMNPGNVYFWAERRDGEGFSVYATDSEVRAFAKALLEMVGE